MLRSKSEGGKLPWGDKKRKANDVQSPSTASSSSPSTTKYVFKKLKVESHPETKENDKNDDNYVGAKEMDDLPPEVLVQILKSLSAFDLIKKCRLVNRKWLEVASLALSYHEKSTRVKFKIDTTKGSSPHTYKFKERYWTCGKTLQELMDCYNSSTFFPYNNFVFKSAPAMEFNSPDITAFFSEMGSTIKSLTLISNFTEEVVPLLRKLLFELAPNIQELKLLEPSNRRIDVYVIRSYFPADSIFMENDDDESGGGGEKEELTTKVIQLPHLRQLTVGEHYNNCYLQLVTDIVVASPNLTFINGPWNKKLTSGDIRFWFSVPRKFRTSQVGVDPYPAVINCWNDEVVGKDKLEKLPDWDVMRIVANEMEHRYFGRTEAANFVNMIFECKKDKIKYVEMGAIGVLPGIDWSNFDGVEKLYLKNINHTEMLHKINIKDYVTSFFPSKASTINMFPNVKEIDFYLGCPKKNFPSKGNIPKLLSVETATINGEAPKVCIEKIAVLCPNLTKVVIKFPQLCFTAVAKVMWKLMKNLQELTIYVDLCHSPRNAFPELDSGFTGLTKETCENLWERMRAGEDRQSLSAEFDTIPRKHASIMDLKDLRKLDVKVSCLDLNYEREGKLRNSVTDISYIFAFDRMPSVQVNVQKERYFEEAQYYRVK